MNLPAHCAIAAQIGGGVPFPSLAWEPKICHYIWHEMAGASRSARMNRTAPFVRDTDQASGLETAAVFPISRS
jgi:hypothetical protein